MFIPAISVTFIGLVVGVLASPRWGLVRGLIRGLGGAWIGFVVGGLLGAIVDVVSGTGIWVAVAGHIGAFAGAVLLSNAAKRCRRRGLTHEYRRRVTHEETTWQECGSPTST
jgi:outer membrane lipoprotein SlyB